MQGAGTKQSRKADRGAARTEGSKDDGADGAKVAAADMVRSDGGGSDRTGDTKVDAAGGGDKQAGAVYHGMSAAEAKDSQTIVALQSPVTVMRPVRGDLEEHVPKPCENLVSCLAF
jgi:peroxygenase